MGDRHIIGLGGGGDSREQSQLLWDYAFDIVGKDRPRHLFIPTAAADDDFDIVWFYDRFARRSEATHLKTFPWPPSDLRELILSQDLVCVSGGNTANMLAIWRVHGIDTLLREAWENGVVLWGASAGMICWFESGITDSFGPQLESMECLGWLAGSACPHYDGEERRRPRYRELIEGGLAPGIAAEDGVALHYVGTELVEAVTCRSGASAFRVTAEGEEQIATRQLV